MKRMKLFSIALMLALAGSVYAAGNAQDSKKACSMDKADCCANCCKSEGSCCKADKMGHKQTAGQAAQESKEKTCASCDCCKDGKSCCKGDKSGKESAKACACDMKDKASCCASATGGCCGDACGTKEKAKTN